MAVLTLAVAARSHDSTAPQASPTVSGAWSGTFQGVTTLSEGVGGAVSGSGNITGDGGSSIALIVRQGTHVYPDLTLVLDSTGFQDLNFTGHLSSATEMTGTLNGSGFDNFNLNLTKR